MNIRVLGSVQSCELEDRADSYFFDLLTERLRQFADLLSAEGINIRLGAHEKTVAAFQGQSVVRQEQIFKDFCKYSDLIEIVQKEGIPLRDHKKVTWACMKALRLRPEHDAFGFLNDDEVIEIYNRDHVQIFRNLRFFELCGYAVMDVLVHDWPTLYERVPEGVTTQVFEQTAHSFLKGARSQYYEGIEDHQLREKFSSDGRKLVVQMGMHSPVYSTDQGPSAEPVGVLLSLHAKII